MCTFFTELAGLLADKQQIRMTVAKTGDELTVLLTADGKIINASGTPQEMDENLLAELNKGIKEKTFTFSVSESGIEKEEEEEDGNSTKIDKKDKIQKPAKAEKSGSKKQEQPKEKESVKEEKKEEKSPAEPSKEEEQPKVDNSEAQNKQRVFNDAMAKGAAFLSEKKYNEAQVSFQDALNIFPEDGEAVKQYAIAEKWVKAMNIDL